MSTRTLHGRGGKVMMAVTPVGDAIALGQARAWKFKIDQDLIENTQGFGAIWKTWLLAATSWTASIDGNLDTNQTTPFDAAQQPNQATYGPVRFYFYPDGTNNARFYSGTGWPNLTVEARLREVIRFTLDITGDGPWKQDGQP
jgi:hypothetical protein